jgi:hypothetical protein
MPDDSSNASEDPIHRSKRLPRRQCTRRSRLADLFSLPWEARGRFFPGCPPPLSSDGLRGESVYVIAHTAEESCSCVGRRGESPPNLCLWFVVPVLGLSVWWPAGPPLLGSLPSDVSLLPLGVLARPMQGQVSFWECVTTYCPSPSQIGMRGLGWALPRLKLLEDLCFYQAHSFP